MTDLNTSKTGSLRRMARVAGITLVVLCSLNALVIVLAPLLFQPPEDFLRWQAWRVEHSGYMFIWRLTLYTALTIAWIKLKSHRGKNSSPAERKQTRRIETLMVLLLLMIELVKAVL